MDNFRLQGLDPKPFEHLFALDDQKLAALNIQRVQAIKSPGYPCRVSLEDARVGEELLLLPFQHQSASSPYQSSGPIFVRRGAARRSLESGDVPTYVTSRQISLRAYDEAHMMVLADVVDGTDVAQRLASYFSGQVVSYVHLHNAKRGCYSCLAVRP